MRVYQGVAMTYSDLFSVLFFLACSIALILGVHTLLLNPKHVLNRLYFYVSYLLSIWSFSFAMVNSTKVYQEALFFRRVSSIGWGLVFSVLLHFTLTITSTQDRTKHPLRLISIYAPAIPNLFFFGISTTFANQQYQLELHDFGWINVAKFNLIDWYYNIYYCLFSALSIYLLVMWYKKTKDPIKKKRARYLMLSIMISVLIGTFTELIINHYTGFHIPQIAPILVMIPMGFEYYMIRKYGLRTDSETESIEKSYILTPTNILRIYQSISILFVFGGLLHFYVGFFVLKYPLKEVILFGLVFVLFGVAIQIINRINALKGVSEVLIGIILAISIPIITMRFISEAGVTIWAYAFLIVILSVMFIKKITFIIISISMFVTQLAVWIICKDQVVDVVAGDHITRIALLAIAIGVAYYLNQIYIKRLSEINKQIEGQKMVYAITTSFISMTPNNMDDKIQFFCDRVGNYFELNQIILHNEAVNCPRFSWKKNVVQIPIQEIVDKISKYEQQAESKRSIIELEEVSSPIHRLIYVPIYKTDELFGRLLLIYSSKDSKAKCVRNKIVSNAQNENLLLLLGNLLSDAFQKLDVMQEIDQRAFYDQVTGLPNRTLYQNRLEQSIYLAQRTETILGVMCLDIDSFKSINDTIGHANGDKVLVEVASRIASCIRKQDTVARFSGDKFLILIAYIRTYEDIQFVADKILHLFEKPILLDDREYFLAVNLGIAAYPLDGDTEDSLIKNAELAMYLAKKNGKNTYSLCSSEMKEEILLKMKLTNQLYRALERDELFLVYQPQINIRTQKVVGLEALIRWNTEEFGLVMPSEFISIAEHTGLIHTIGLWVITSVCEQIVKWNQLGFNDICVAVNLSVEQFRDMDLVDKIIRILDDFDIDKKCIEIEITESVTEWNHGSCVEMLNKLHDQGVRLAIDDFGTEYSSLSRLKTIPVDKLKMDMQFVRGISEGGKAEAIAKSIIQLAKNLQISVVAEGVETKEEYNFFEKEGCDEIQGYYYYRPMDVTAITNLLELQEITPR